MGSAPAVATVPVRELTKSSPNSIMVLLVNGERICLSAPTGRGYNAQFRPQLQRPVLGGIGVKEMLLEEAASSDPLRLFICTTSSTVMQQEVAHMLDYCCLKPQAVWLTPLHHALIVCPLMDGHLGELQKFLDPSSVRVAAWLTLASVSATLTKCHARGLVHRDIKLDNILWRFDGAISLGDFGSMRSVGNDGYRQDMHGTFCFVAPEMVFSFLYDTKLDLWGLGVAIGELLAPGHKQWQGPFLSPVPTGLPEVGRHEQRMRFVRQNLLALEAHGRRLYNQQWGKYFATIRAIDSNIECLMLRLLAFNPEDRPPASEVELTALSNLHSLPQDYKLRFKLACEKAASKSAGY